MEKKIEELTWLASIPLSLNPSILCRNLQARNGEISNLRARLQSTNEEMDKLRTLNHDLIQSRGKGGSRVSSDLEKEISQVKTNLAFKENEYNSLTLRFGEVERNLKLARERCQQMEMSKSKLEQELHAAKKRCLQGDVSVQKVSERQDRYIFKEIMLFLIRIYRLSQSQAHKCDFSMQVDTDSMASHRRPTFLDPDSRQKLKRLRSFKALFPETIEEFVSNLEIDGEVSANSPSTNKARSDQSALLENGMYKMLSAFVNGIITADDLRGAIERKIRKQMQDTGSQAPKLDRLQREDMLLVTDRSSFVCKRDSGQDLHITLRSLHALLIMSTSIRLLC
eukprot:306915-Hanusia_phi.AAC.3